MKRAVRLDRSSAENHSKGSMSPEGKGKRKSKGGWVMGWWRRGRIRKGMGRERGRWERRGWEWRGEWGKGNVEHRSRVLP